VNHHVNAVSILWALAGVALVALAAHGLVTESRFESVVVSWLITLGCGALAIIAAITFWRRGLTGRVLVRIVSVLVLIYAAAWLIFGGIEQASAYWPWIIISSGIAVYALWVAGRVARAV
jgi:hypothetical protein